MIMTKGAPATNQEERTGSCWRNSVWEQLLEMVRFILKTIKAPSAGHPLKRGELKVKEGTHGTEPLGQMDKMKHE